MENLRNIAIIAHVDHRKTTMVDKLHLQTCTHEPNELTHEPEKDSNE
ncbi:GTP-binding protein, partial [Pseudomonas syringae group genomosp. 7]